MTPPRRRSERNAFEILFGEEQYGRVLAIVLGAFGIQSGLVGLLGVARGDAKHPALLVAASLVGVLAGPLLIVFRKTVPARVAFVVAFMGGYVFVAGCYAIGPASAPVMGSFACAAAALLAALFTRRVAVVAMLLTYAGGAVFAFALVPGIPATLTVWTYTVSMSVIVFVVTSFVVTKVQRLAETEQASRAEADEARAEAERAREALELANQHKSAFLANMSHELRTPLNAVIGFSDVLNERLFGDLNEKQAEYVGDIRSSGEHLLSLVNDILDLSKVEAGRMELELSDVSVPELVTSVASLFRDQAARSNIALNARVADDAAVLAADERKVRQALVNLMANAIRFTPGGGAVSLSATRENGHVVFSVTDTGPGIVPEKQEHIFEEFAQLGTNGRGPGTGLGLALARRFTELHGGRLDVESTPGQGATFNLKLPVQS